MEARIYNQLHDMTVPFDERSAGFVWFFSFLVMFSQVQKQHGNVIILLDEPGLNLHAKAQSDLLRYFKEKLRPRHQVIYTTHSPFMVPPDDLASVRTVEDVVEQRGMYDFATHGTKVGDKVFSTDRDTLFPLQGALGYDITQSLFIGKHTLLVEGSSDLIYLQIVSSVLEERGRTGIDPRWIICPVGGIDKVQTFLSLLRGNSLDVAVLTDYAKGQKNKIEAVRKLLNDGWVFTASDIAMQDEADTEDLLGTELYADFVNNAYALDAPNLLTAASLDAVEIATPRVMRRVEHLFKTMPPGVPEFDHMRVAIWLSANVAASFEPSPITDAAVDRFERLFKNLNALLLMQ